MANTRQENAELQKSWDLEEQDRVVRRYKIALLIGVIAIYGFLGWIVWLALQLKGIVG